MQIQVNICFLVMLSSVIVSAFKVNGDFSWARVVLFIHQQHSDIHGERVYGCKINFIIQDRKWKSPMVGITVHLVHAFRNIPLTS